MPHATLELTPSRLKRWKQAILSAKGDGEAPIDNASTKMSDGTLLILELREAPKYRGAYIQPILVQESRRKEGVPVYRLGTEVPVGSIDGDEYTLSIEAPKEEVSV